jgi:hypothetical protein
VGSSSFHALNFPNPNISLFLSQASWTFSEAKVQKQPESVDSVRKPSIRTLLLDLIVIEIVLVYHHIRLCQGFGFLFQTLNVFTTISWTFPGVTNESKHA